MKEKIEDASKRLYFVITLILFFPILLQAIFGLPNSGENNVNEVILKSGISLSFLIICYIIFEIRKNKISSIALKFLNATYLLIVACFASLLIFFAYVTNEDSIPQNWILENIFLLSLWGFMWLPVVSVIIVIIDFFIVDLID